MQQTYCLQAEQHYPAYLVDLSNKNANKNMFETKLKETIVIAYNDKTIKIRKQQR